MEADTTVLIVCRRRVKSPILSGGNQIVYNFPQKKETPVIRGLDLVGVKALVCHFQPTR